LKVWLPALRAGSGADVFVERLAEGLREAGATPTITWFDLGLEVMPWRLRGTPIPEGTDIIHAGTGIGHVFMGRGVPVVVTEHQYIRHPAFMPQRGFVQRLYHDVILGPSVRKSIRRADKVFAVSEHVARAMTEDLGVVADVVHNWVDTSLFHPRMDSRAPGPLRVLWVGNPSRWKGVDCLLDVAEAMPGVQFLAAGGLRRAFPATELANIMVMPPRSPAHMPALYREADVVLVSSRYEAFGYVALEAMASALAVVGFDVSGTAEVCIDGQTALLAPLDDIKALTAHVAALSDDALRARLGEAGRQRALSNFSGGVSIARYVDAYKAILDKEYG